MNDILIKLGIEKINMGATSGTKWLPTTGELTESFSPADNSLIAKVRNASALEYNTIVENATEAFSVWSKMPAPLRGEVVRQIGDALRASKEDLATLVSLEMGKIYQESLGEVQEMIDICDFAVGQSRLLNGYTMRSERPDHRMYDQYHPIGIVGIISSFNFPVAVWAWNSMISAVAGDVVIWKPSSKTPLTAIATQNIIREVLIRNNVPEGVFSMIIARSSVLGNRFIEDKRIPLFSVTGSTEAGREVARIIGHRLGRVILELGGNNAVIISARADLQMAVKSVLFGAIGTTGQRCTSTRRVIIQTDIYDEVRDRLLDEYKKISMKIGNPLDSETLVGPLIDSKAVAAFSNALVRVKKEGGRIIFGGNQPEGEKYSSGNYVVPALVEAENNYEIVREETFAPVLYLMKYETIEEAIMLNNDVPQGLSSSLFTTDLRESELFLSAAGSDCGIANVNIGTSGAEIGGAFGGEKDTGGGRESGSDAWKAYMRRQTNTINYGTGTPLAQGIQFGL